MNRSSVNHTKASGSFKNISYCRYKRPWEVAFIILFSPIILILMLLISSGIKFNSIGPILFIQNRIGQDGKIFSMYKFRSMKFETKEHETRFEEEDERITSLGKFLRKTHIDELSQFWNVLKGDMSLAGPRPEQPNLVKFFNKKIPFYSKRHNVPPGITGLAQIKTGNSTSVSSTQKKLKYDLYYIRNKSFILDISIIYTTISIIIISLAKCIYNVQRI